MFSASRNAIAALLVLATAGVGVSPAGAATSASINRQFSAAVARILNSVRNDQPFLHDLSTSEFHDFVSCAQGVMDDAPLARKQYVLAARTPDQMRQRFDEVALDNRAELKQRITRECS